MEQAETKRGRGRPAAGNEAMSNAERSRLARERRRQKEFDRGFFIQEVSKLAEELESLGSFYPVLSPVPDDQEDDHAKTRATLDVVTRFRALYGAMRDKL